MPGVPLAALDQTAAPAIAAQLEAFGHLSWVVPACLLTATAASPLHGKLSGIHGRRAQLLPAPVLFIVASVLRAASVGRLPRPGRPGLRQPGVHGTGRHRGNLGYAAARARLRWAMRRRTASTSWPWLSRGA